MAVEHIIVDGGSTDNTVEIIKQYASGYSHIRWVSEKDSGQSDAMNKGILMSKNEYVSFLNADDDYEKNALNRVISIIQEKNPVFICSNCNVWDDKNDFLFISRPKDNTLFLSYFKQTFPINPSSYFYQKKVHEKIGFYDVNDHLTMDLDFFLRYMNHFKSYTYIDEVWGNFRVSESTKTYQDRERGMMFSRKKEKFDHYWRQNPRYLRYYFIFKNMISRILK